MAAILGIGVAVLDIVLSVDGYPAEDAKLRAAARRMACGGNAANTLTVLATLGHRCGLASTLAADADGERLTAELRARNIDLSPARVHPADSTPVSYIFHNVANGSRTIVHYRTLPELTTDDFARVELDAWDWLHFEGREIEATAGMMERALAAGKTLSLEVEKPRPGIERLFPLASALIFSRAYVESLGTGAAEFLDQLRGRLPGRQLFCAWGADGAWTVDADGKPLHTPPWIPPRIVDTLGAGDTFNAGIIDGLVRGRPPAETLTAACRLAGEKCGGIGLPATGAWSMDS
ncbi:MAG: PfkB family carbohydrate kinase [Gammaproteobacteria bacterium]|jgi:ketohexokinase|nr:PfkB family carbohydrate kinase [Gammaproteobacteria bacterium]